MKNRKIIEKLILLMIVFLMVFSSSPVLALATQEELNEEAEKRKSETVETNEIEGWPLGPVNGASAAILMDADSGTILYSKNIDAELFPASTTKIMTCLVAIENCSLDEVITVKQSAIDANESDGSNMGLRAGETLTLEEMLYGILINSANEACNAVGEHIAGSQEAFVQMMNDKAKELGCTHTHFVTTNGLSDPDHYTSAHDLALIAREFYKYDILCKISSTGQYTIPENEMHREFFLVSHNKLTAGREYAYEGLIGSKTGFTSVSRQTLVSCAERNGIRLICVILKEESPYQFVDSVALFDYGFNNFYKIKVTNYETTFNIKQPDYFTVGNDLFGSTTELITIDDKATLLIPNTITFKDLESEIVYGHTLNPAAFASVSYTYNGASVGYADIMINSEISSASANSVNKGKEDDFVIFNINRLMITLSVIMLILVLFMIFGGMIKNFIDNQIRLYKIKKSRKESEPKRRPHHKKHKKEPKETDNNENTTYAKKRKHTTYKKPAPTALYDKDAKKPGNRRSKRIDYKNITREIRRKEFFEDYERIDIDIDEDDY